MRTSRRPVRGRRPRSCSRTGRGDERGAVLGERGRHGRAVRDRQDDRRRLAVDLRADAVVGRHANRRRPLGVATSARPPSPARVPEPPSSSIGAPHAPPRNSAKRRVTSLFHATVALPSGATTARGPPMPCPRSSTRLVTAPDGAITSALSAVTTERLDVRDQAAVNQPPAAAATATA